MRIKLPKILNEEMYNAYFQEREGLRNRSLFEQRAHSDHINELNLRIVQWQCRNDDHNPVQTFEPLIINEPKKNGNEGPKPDMRGQWRRKKKNDNT